MREAIALVPQEPTLFSGSVRDNIHYAKPEAAITRLKKPLKLPTPTASSCSLAKGYDTEIGERGVKLSGGKNSASPSPERF
ncbi:MAG: hypothetical protein R2880_13470 [Deinococcales bacterium]